LRWERENGRQGDKEGGKESKERWGGEESRGRIEGECNVVQ